MTSGAPARLEDPYVGPVSFRLGDALYGRDREREDLLDLLIAERIVLLYSPSGAGKSSLIEAALVPALRDAGFEVLPTIRITHSLAPEPGAPEPRNRYVMGTLLSLEEGVPPEKQRPVSELANITLREYLGAFADRDGRPGNEVLVFDQFEEILTADPTDEPAKHAFFKELGEMLRDRSHWALFSMREDFLAALDPYLKYLPTRLRTTFRLDLLSVPEALEAIRRPAHHAGVDFTEEAARRLVDDLRTVRVQRPTGITEVFGSYVEPVQLQVACHLLWSMLPADATEITPADVEAIGKVDEALAGYYADQIGLAVERTGVPERVIRDWFDERLITPQGLRSQVLEGPASASADGHRLMAELLDSHLVRAETRRHATWYELAHDRLIEPVRRDNAAWRAQHLSIVERAAMLWEQEGKPDRLLLLGADLNDAEQDESVRDGSLSRREREFLDASRRADAQVQRDVQTAGALRRSARRLWVAVGLTTLLAVTSLIFLTQSVVARGSAARQEETTRLLLAAHENWSSDAFLAAALAVEGATRLDAADFEIAHRLLYRAAQTPVVTALRGQVGATSTAAWSEDGTKIATAGRDEIRLWERDGGTPLERLAMEEDDVVTSVDVNTDGSIVAASTTDGELIVWEVGEDPVRWEEGTGDVWWIDLSSDGRRLVSVGPDKTRLWGVDGTLERTLTGPESDFVYLATFSPDGRLLATSSDQSEVLLWDVQSGRQVGQLLLPDGDVPWNVWFGEDSNTIATYTQNAVTVWDVGTNLPVYPPLEALSDSYNMSIDLSQALAVDSWGGLTAYDMASGAPVAEAFVSTPLCCAGLIEPGLAIVLTQDEVLAPTLWHLEPYRESTATSGVVVGTSVFTAWDDGALRRWDAGESDLGAQTIPDADATDVVQLAADGNGDRVIGTTLDGRVLVWDASTGEQLAALDQDYYTAAALTPDGRKMVVAGLDGVVALWDVARGEEERVIFESPNEVSRIHISEEGETALLAFESIDRQEASAVVASLTEGPDPVTLTLPGGNQGQGELVETVTAAAFDPDGRRVTVGTSEGRVVSFDSESGERKKALVAHRGEVAEMVADPSTGTLLTIGHPSELDFSLTETQVVLVDPDKGSVRTVPAAHDLISAMITPDGEDLVLFEVDGTVWTVPLEDEELLNVVRGKVAHQLTSEDSCYYANVGC